MIFEYFLSDKFDSKVLLVDNDKSYNVSQFKKIVASNIEILKNKCKNIVISTSDNFSFMVEFFASVFAGKNIYLLSDTLKLKELDFEYFKADNISLLEAENIDFKEIDPKETIINFYTSGSSGSAKIIKKSLFNLIQEGIDIGEEFNLKNKDYTVISTTSMCHLFGMTFHLMTSICNGLIIGTKKISYPENVEGSNAILVSTPAFLSSILKYDIPFKIPPKYIITAGSKLNDDVFKFLEEKSNVIEIYGSTETGVIAHKTHYCDNLELFKNVKVKINEDNIEVESDYLYGKSAIINDKIELSGRELKVKTRTDRLYKIMEKRVSAPELENCLKENEFVKDCYIIKSSDKLVCMCALNEKGKDFLIKNNIPELTKKLKQYLLNFSEIIPQKWRYIDEIPMNKYGKTDKAFIEHIFNVNLSLPVILDKTVSKDSITFKLFFYNQCNFFNGHFPTFKLVPGVVQLYLAKELANWHFETNCGGGQWKRIKFSNVIQPDSIINLKLEKKEKQVVYEYFSEDKNYSSGVFMKENIFANVNLEETL